VASRLHVGKKSNRTWGEKISLLGKGPPVVLVKEKKVIAKGFNEWSEMFGRDSNFQGVDAFVRKPRIRSREESKRKVAAS